MVWADSDYGYKKKITIDHTLVVGDETNFPVLVSVTDADLADTGNGGLVESANGYDIVFYDSAESTKLEHEIEVYTNTNGTLVYWVKINSLDADADTDFYIYFGKAGVVVDPSSTDTWDSDFLAVWHMASVNDSTSNGINLTNNGVAFPPSAKAGYSGDFNGTTDYLSHATFLETMPASDILTCEAWVYHDQLGTGQNYISKNNRDNADRFALRKPLDDKPNWYTEGSNNIIDLDHTTDVVISTWHHIVGVYDNGAKARIYRDTNEVESAGNQNEILNGTESDPFYIGIFFSGAGGWMDGFLDEIRISDVDRGDNWISTTYETIDDPAGFMSFGNLQAGHALADTAEASDSPAFKAEIPLNDTAKASDNAAYVLKKGHAVNDTAKASESKTFKAESKLDDTAKASDAPKFKAEIPLADIARASDSVSFITGEATLHTPSDIARASDSVNFVITTGPLQCLMRKITYHFTSYIDNTNWNNGGNMVDGSLATFASADIASILTLTPNTCVAAAGEGIQTVELRVYGKAGVGSLTNNRTQLIPIFANGDGNTHISQWTSTTASWSEWFNITYDANAPVKWSWDNIINLDCYCQSIGHSSSNKIAKIELRVTYSECDNCDTFSVAGTSHTVLLSAPIWGGENNKINKNIDRKSFWSGNYKVNDDGIGSQPLVLTGIETAPYASDLCGIAFEDGACFSLYFNMGFTNKMRFMIEMANDNEEITISGLGDCMDGVYVIKNFRYNTIIGAINTYTWNMTLEKVR